MSGCRRAEADLAKALETEAGQRNRPLRFGSAADLH